MNMSGAVQEIGWLQSVLPVQIPQSSVYKSEFSDVQIQSMLDVHSAPHWVSLAQYPVFASKLAMVASCFEARVEKHFSKR